MVVRSVFVDEFSFAEGHIENNLLSQRSNSCVSNFRVRAFSSTARRMSSLKPSGTVASISTVTVMSRIRPFELVDDRVSDVTDVPEHAERIEEQPGRRNG